MKSLTEQFTDWVRMKPADEEYNFGSVSNCAFSQFLRDTHDADDPICSSLGWWDRSEGRCNRRPPVVSDDVLKEYPQTFGALASRLSASHPTNRSPSGQGGM